MLLKTFVGASIRHLRATSAHIQGPTDTSERSTVLSSDSSPAHAQTQPANETIDPAGMRVIWLLLVAAFVAILNETTMAIAIPELNKAHSASHRSSASG
jgi:hypothetical protein